MHTVNSRRLYLRGLNRNTTEEELHKFLSCYGKINEVKLLSNYAFVQFESEMAATIVLETFQSQPLMGKKVIIEYSHPLRKDMPSISSSNTSGNHRSPPSKMPYRHPVIVMDIPAGICWQELKDFGRLSGRLVAFCDLDKVQMGRGFIEYFSREDAKKAARILDGKRLGGHPVRVIDYETRRNTPRGRLRRRSSSRSSERHKLQVDNAKQTRNENTENVGPQWDMYYAPEPQNYEAPGRWNPYSPHYAFAQGPRSYERPRSRNEGAEGSAFERISNWATDCGFRQGDRPHEYSRDYYRQEQLGYGGCSSVMYRDNHERPFDPYQ